MTEQPRILRGLLDTSVIIGLTDLEAAALPGDTAISALTIAELSAGPHTTADPNERAKRIDRLQRAEAAFHPLPFDIKSARAYGRIVAAAVHQGRSPRGQRAVDLLIAATALSGDLPLVTRNGKDFRFLEGLMDVSVV